MSGETEILACRRAISGAVDTERAVEKAYRDAGDNKDDLRSDLWRAQNTTRLFWDELHKLQAAESEKFAASRGWRLYKGRQGHVYTNQLIAGRMTYGAYGYPRDVADVRYVIDHRDCFMTSPPGKTSQQSCRYPAAILSHTYGEWEPCVEFAQWHGLGLERLPYSWYYPGQCIAALFTHIPK